jgi:hypothetical protein
LWTRTHILRSVGASNYLSTHVKERGNKRTCGTLLEKEHLAWGYSGNEPPCKREHWANNLLDSAPRREVGPKGHHARRLLHLGVG